MCYNKLHLDLSYRCRYFFNGHSQNCIHDVPCGICEECIRDIQMDYFIRMKSEYEQCVANGGKVAFLTFTYRDDRIPAYSYHYDSELKNIVFDRVNAKTSNLPFIYSFDRSNIQRFFNSYRKRFERMGVYSPFRYIVVGEYGTDAAYTQRSHFHVLIYYSKLAVEMLQRYTPFASIDWTIIRDVNELWTHGYVSESHTCGLFISSPDACSYCSKYVSKTMTLANLRRFSVFRDFIKTHFNSLLPDGYDGKPSVDGYFRHYLKKIGSNLYTLKSKNFGQSALNDIRDCIKHGDYQSAFDLFSKGYPYCSNGEQKYIGYSMYYFRKLCYNTRSDGSYYLNPVGVFFQKNILFNSSQSLVDLWKNIDYRLLPANDYNFVCEFLNNTPLIQVAYYKLFAENLSMPVCQSDCDVFGHFGLRRFNLSFNDLFSLKYSYLCDSRLADSREPYSITFGDFISSTDLQYDPPFVLADYSHFISLASSLINSSRELKSIERRTCDSKAKYLRDINNNYIYSHLNP